MLGTASYISPEQAAAAPAGPASDVYSFGVILFRMLTGRLPFSSPSAMELVRMHRDEPPPAIASLRPDAPAVLAAVVSAALDEGPSESPRRRRGARPRARPMKALYFGTYDREHPRNVNAIAALRAADVEVVERSARVRGRRLPRCTQRVSPPRASCSSRGGASSTS